MSLCWLAVIILAIFISLLIKSLSAISLFSLRSVRLTSFNYPSCLCYLLKILVQWELFFWLSESLCPHQWRTVPMAQGPLKIPDGMWSSLFKIMKKNRRRICSIFAYRTLAIRAHCRQVENSMWLMWETIFWFQRILTLPHLSGNMRNLISGKMLHERSICKLLLSENFYTYLWACQSIFFCQSAIKNINKLENCWSFLPENLY